MPADRLRAPRYVVGWGLVVAIGLATLVIHGWHLLGEDEMGAPQLLLGVVGPVGLALLLLGLAVWTHREGFDPQEMLAIGSWAGMGFLVFAWVGAGAMLYYLIQDAPIYDPVMVTFTIGSAGALAGSIVGLYDVRGRRARAGYRVQRDRAEQLTERLSILNRVFRHDIRTELTVLIGHARIAKAECEQSVEPHLETVTDRAEAIERLSEQARTLQNTIDQATTRTAQDVCQVLHSLQDKFDNRYPEASIGISGPEQAVVQASVKLEAAIEEILENAIAHGDGGTIEVSVEESQSTVEIVVRDWGPGIPPEEIEIIDSAVETPMRHSSGMGLWTVKWIVEASDGTFEIEAVDSGTRVTMVLPRPDSP